MERLKGIAIALKYILIGFITSVLLIMTLILIVIIVFKIVILILPESIEDRIHHQCEAQQRGCRIKMSDIVEKDWDTMWIAYGVNNEMRQQIGLERIKYGDEAYPGITILWTKNNVITREYRCEMEDENESFYVCVWMSSVNYGTWLKYSRDEAIFDVDDRSQENTNYSLYLTPIH